MGASSNYDYNRFTPDPDDVFQESVGHYEEIQSLIADPDLKDQGIAYEAHLFESTAMMVFRSDNLENAGSSYPITERIAKEIFAGGEVPYNITEGDEDYKSHLEYLMLNERAQDQNEVLKSRRQVIQHAYAWKYITYHMVVKGEDLSENLLKETHKILMEGIEADNKDRDKSGTYAGIYRTDDVVWTFVTFANPKSIPKKMADAVAEFNNAIKEAESKGFLDPYALASKTLHTILNIHPFLDGNSRLCRLLMNTILLKYTGIAIPIGRDEIEEAKWKETVTRASEVELAGDDESEGQGKAAYAEITTLVSIQGRSMLRELKERLVASKDGQVYSRRKSIAGYHWNTSEDAEEEEKYF